MRLAGNRADAAPLQVMFYCNDESAETDSGGVWGRAGYSLEKYLPEGAIAIRKPGDGGAAKFGR
jgi:hypothetical protein